MQQYLRKQEDIASRLRHKRQLPKDNIVVHNTIIDKFEVNTWIWFKILTLEIKKNIQILEVEKVYFPGSHI